MARKASIYLKLHSGDSGDVLAMCDLALIDKVLSEEEREMNIRDYSDFYKGDLLAPEDVEQRLRGLSFTSANIVGEESVNLALKSGIIEKGHVAKIMKVPYAYAVSIK